ncbi:HNH endonuclease [bacterium]|nr:HNH endonuclease [bacterium]
MIRVYVINKNGNPLMPCKPAKARHLLRDGKAKVVKRKPFTIQLLWDCEKNVQEIRCGIDKGCKVTGIACVGNGEILYSASIKHRNPVAVQQKNGCKTFVQVRAERRRSRRNRHRWYRKPRFDNRASSKRSGKLPPTIKMNVMEVVRGVRKIDLPISHITVEDVAVDIRRLSNPDVQGSEYQQSNRLDENLRLACLIRDDFTCQKCSRSLSRLHRGSPTTSSYGKKQRPESRDSRGKREAKLQAHHVVWTSKGGKDSIYNLITLCENCHDKVHKTGESGKVQLKRNKVVTGMSGFSDKITQRTMQGKTLMYQELKKIAPLSCVFGYQTSAFRKALDLPKEHWIDAVCLTCLQTGEVVVSLDNSNHYDIWFRAKQTRRIFNTQPSKGGEIKQWQKYLGLASNGKDCILIDKRDKTFVLPLGYTLYKKGDVISIVGEVANTFPTEIASINGKGKGFYYWKYQSDDSRKYASVSHTKVKLIEYAKTINYVHVSNAAFIPS